MASGNTEQLNLVLNQIGQHVPQKSLPLMMHALRTAARQGNLSVLQHLLGQLGACTPQQVLELMKYALDGAAARQDPAVLDFLLGRIQEAFVTSHPLLLLELVQHSVDEAARQGNLGVLKFLMDRTAAASITVNYDVVFARAAASGNAETLLREAISKGSQYENVILMLLDAARRNLPDNNDSKLGSRQSIKNTAKLQLVKTYKQKDPELFARLMAVVKGYFPEERASVAGDVSM